MALTKEQKQKVIESLREKISRQKIIIFVAISGLKVKNLFNLRKKLKTIGSQLTVAKKTLMKITFQEQKIEINPKEMEGGIALIFGFHDEISPTKIAYEFSKENENFKILGGVFQGEFIGKEKVVEMAKLPSKQELLVKLVGSISTPISGFINVLQGNLKGLLYVLAKAKT